MQTHSKPRLSSRPRPKIALAYLISIAWAATFAVAVALAVINWR